MSETDRAELLLRSSRRALLVLLAIVLLVAATLIAHLVRPGSPLADWPARVSWLFSVAITPLVAALYGRRPPRANEPAVQAMLSDEFRQLSLARAQRVALVVVAVAQIPLMIGLSSIEVRSAVMVMGVATVTIALAALITAFLFFDRE